jgi:hypothetical protein
MASLTGRMSTSSRVSERFLHRSHRIPPLHFQKHDKQLPPGSANCGKLDTQGYLLPPQQPYTGARHSRDPHQNCAHVDFQQTRTRLCTCRWSVRS